MSYSDKYNISHRFSIFLYLYSTVQLVEKTGANISTEALHTSTHASSNTTSKINYDIYFLFMLFFKYLHGYFTHACTKN